ncbi:hypothetical protein [Streptomyces sp. NPDC126514]|uniref:hypothetical protein n=1 Tax=Streptomyces sp. NPDC126514 TaxID=3155210 RepID=UPI0033177E56
MKNLLDSNDLTHVISAATTVTNRLNFIQALHKILADEDLHKNIRGVDQLHPMVNKILWLFGEDWHMTQERAGTHQHPPGPPGGPPR